jgi:hypothetical protein
MDGKSPLEIELPGPLNALKKPIIKKIKGTAIEKDTRNWQKVVTDVVSVHHKNFIQKGCGIYGSDLCNPYH